MGMGRLTARAVAPLESETMCMVARSVALCFRTATSGLRRVPSCMQAAELPTLRLTTLRTLTRHGASIAVVHVSTPLADVLEMLGDPQVWVCAVDDAGNLQGVLSREEALRALRDDPDGWVADHMTRSSMSLQAETDIAEACAAVKAEGADHVLVVTAQGHLLGVVQAAVLATYSRAA